ncbi:MAG: YciI family protein [Alphaproteobacteria bacterium]
MPESTHYLYLLRPTRADMLATGLTEAEAAVVGRHAEYLRKLRDAGTLVLAGRTLTTENTFGIAILRAESEAEAARVMRNDPAIAERVMTASLYPYGIAFMAASPAVG